MKKNEVMKILAVCKGAGVQFGDSDKNVLVEIWTQCFEDNTYEEVSKALIKLIKCKEPLFVNGLIGRIKEKIVEDSMSFLDFTEAWEIIRSAMYRTHPDIPQETIEAFNSLPPILKKLVGSARHLEDMEACLSREDLETVEKSNMKKMYAELVTKTKEQLQLGITPHWLPIDWKHNEKLEGAVKGLVEGHEF